MRRAMERQFDVRAGRFKVYPKYKDSGVEWLGEIPAHWGVRRLKHLCARSALYGANEPAESYATEGVRFLRTTDITDEGHLAAEGVYLPLERARDYLLSDGDILFSRSGTIGRAFVYDEERYGPCAYAGYLVRFVPGPMLDSRFAYYFSKSRSFDQWLAASVISSTIGNVNGQKYGNLELPAPSPDEQRAIADFLDRETAKIDALVARNERLIELLQERRICLITGAVAKGLDHSVPMKGSGVKWLGEVPAHWEIRPLFTLINEREEKNAGLRVANVLSLSYGRIIPRDVESNIGLLPESFETYQIVHPGDIVLRLTDLQNDQRSIRVGFVGGLGIITSAYVCLTVRHTLIPEFAHYVLLGLDMLKVFYGLGGGVRQTMKFGDLRWLPIVCPSQDEQQTIIRFLDRETAKIDVLVAKIREGIERWKEYRTALISAVVMGKIDVREETA